MLFNSLTFIVFILVVFFAYWVIPYKHLWMQNLMLLSASYVFYGWWDWRFLILLFTIACFNYLIGLGIQNGSEVPTRKIFLGLGLFINIGTLFYFKYFNFFVEEFINRLAHFGLTVQNPLLKIILPVGISFYIFLSISYLIDIYHKRLIAPKSIIDVLLTLSFFPIVLAGPIERPISLLPQLQKKRVFDQALATDGLRQILWGLFAKVVIADNCADLVNKVFQDYQIHSGSTLLLGALLFTIQIYADFSGYSNIAIGLAKQFGFNIVQNFNYPYFATNIVEFWRRWNISLTKWFRDYVFLPLAYKVSSKIDTEKIRFISVNTSTYIIGISITWLLTGLWHGANYTFIFWGGIHGLFLVLHHTFIKPKKRVLKKMRLRTDNRIVMIVDWFITFSIVCFGWIFFRADNMEQAVSYILKMGSSSLFVFPAVRSWGLFLLIALFFGVEWVGREHQYPIAKIGLNWAIAPRWSLYYIILYLILLFGGKVQQFVYFQF